jgi:hypothetical protein
MDENEGARRELIQTVRHAADLSRQNVEINGKMAAAYGSRQGGVTALPTELLNVYAQILRDEAASCLRLAEAIEHEAGLR